MRSEEEIREAFKELEEQKKKVKGNAHYRHWYYCLKWVLNDGGFK